MNLCEVGDRCSGVGTLVIEHRVKMWSLERWPDCMMKEMPYLHVYFGIIFSEKGINQDFVCTISRQSNGIVGNVVNHQQKLLNFSVHYFYAAPNE